MYSELQVCAGEKGKEGAGGFTVKKRREYSPLKK